MSNTIEITPPAPITVEVGSSILAENLPRIPADRLPPGTATQQQISEAIATHTAAADPHPQYQTSAEVSAAISAALVGIGGGAAVDTAIATHEGKSDPHPQYTTGVEVGVAVNSGINDHETDLDPHPQYTTTAEANTAINAAIGAHASAADPHPQYLTPEDVQPLINSAIETLRAELLAMINQGGGNSSPVATVTQSSVWNNRPEALATFQTLTDGLGGSGGGAYGWIMLDYQTPQTFSSVQVGGGEWSGLIGGVAAYINGNRLQFSADGQNWTNLVTITGVENSGANQFKTFNFASTTARYWRLFNEAWVFTSEFKLM